MNPCDFRSNLHKWAFCPHAACILYARHRLNHPIVSWDAGTERGILDEVWTGTRDYSSCVVVPHAVAFLMSMEEKKMGAARNRERVWEEAEMLSNTWRTPWPIQPKETASGMVMVRLPDKYIDKLGRPGTPGGLLQNELRAKNHKEVLELNTKMEEKKWEDVADEALAVARPHLRTVAGGAAQLRKKLAKVAP